MSIRYGLKVGLDDVLSNKEARVKRQGEWLKRHPSFAVVYRQYARSAENDGVHGANLRTGCTSDSSHLSRKGWSIAGRQLLRQVTGPEAILRSKHRKPWRSNEP